MNQTDDHIPGIQIAVMVQRQMVGEIGSGFPRIVICGRADRIDQQDFSFLPVFRRIRRIGILQGGTDQNGAVP